MLKPNMTKSEIEQDLKGKGDLVQIDHLTRFLKEPVAMDTKKFIFLKLADIYEKAKMFAEAAKMYNNAADLSIPFAEKIKHYLKECELFVKLGAFDRAENAMKKALSQANLREKEGIYNYVKQSYKQEAAANESMAKRNNAIKYYEKMLEMRISESERTDIKKKLLQLYKEAGKIKEYSYLEKSLG